MDWQVTRIHETQLRVAPAAAHRWASGPGLCFSVSALYTLSCVPIWVIIVARVPDQVALLLSWTAPPQEAGNAVLIVLKSEDNSSAVATRLAPPGQDPGRSPGALETTRGPYSTALLGRSVTQSPGASGSKTDPVCRGPRGSGRPAGFGPRLVSDQHGKS